MNAHVSPHPPSDCLPADALRALMAGELTSDQEASLSEHLERCPACERLAEQLSDDGPTRALLHQHQRLGYGAASGQGTGPQESPADLEEIRERLHVLGWFQGSEALAGGSTHATQLDGTHSTQTSSSGRTAPPPATTVGKFEIVELIGGGGFGMVYLARDRVLNRQVALKLARTSVLADPDLKTRFLREAEALARLEHPGIVPVHEAGECEGTCYLAVGYCDGPTLEKWLRDEGQEVAPRLAARIALALAEAVEHAHQHGILHRDIKPSNILLDKVEGPPSARELPFVPKLTDFGLAKIAEQPADNTISGVVMGTLQYMATEQAAGLVERIGGHERPPIRGATAIDTLRRVLVEEPVRPQQRARQVPDDLDAIVMRCLDKSPTRRYSSAADLAADLKRFLEGRATVARPLTLGQRSIRWIQHNQAISAVLGLVSLVLMLGAGLLAYDQRLKSLSSAHDRQRAEAAYRDDVYTAGQRYAAGDVAQTAELLKRQRPAADGDDLRSFEWHYLWAQTTHDKFAQAKAAGDVYQVAVSPSGDQVAAACMDGKLYLYSTQTLAQQAVIVTGKSEINGVAYSPDGSRIATVGDDGFVRIRDSQTHAPLASWLAHAFKAYNVVYYDSGRKLATCGEEPVIRLWDAATGQSDGVLEGHTGPVEAIVLSPVENLLASASEDHEAITWDLTTKTLCTRLQGHTDKLSSLAFSPDGKWLATGGQDCAVCLWRHAAGRRRSRGFHLDAVQSVAFAKDGRLIAGDRGGTVRTYQLGPQFPEVALESALEIAEDHWLAHEGKVWSLIALTGDGQFVSSGRDGQLRAWERGQTPIQRWKTDGDSHYAGDFSRDATRLFVLRQNAGVEVFDAASAKSLNFLHLPRIHWDSLAVLPGREQVAAGSQSGEIAIWNWRSTNCVHQWKFGDQPFQRLRYSPAANLLAAIAYAREDVLILDANTGEKLAELPAPSCTDCAFSPDGRTLVVDTLNQLAFYDLRTYLRTRLVPAHSQNINAIAYSPNGELIATGSGDRTVRLWTADGQNLAELAGHASDVFALAFTPDGRSLLTGAGDGRLKIFHVATRRELIDIPIGFRQIRRIAVAPCCTQVAVVGDDWEFALIRVDQRGADD